MKRNLIYISLLLCSVFITTGCDNKKSETDNVSIKEIKEANVGDLITFGTYEQDNDTSSGKEKIEWIVLEKKDNKLLVLSKNGLDAKEYYNEEADITWDESTLRTWLNAEFLINAFSSDEQSKITTSTIDDKIYLLSLTEARTYLDIDGVKECKPTEYAIFNGAGSTSKGYAWWWLRSTHDKGEVDYLYFVNDEVKGGYAIMSTQRNSVRPAMWITID